MKKVIGLLLGLNLALWNCGGNEDDDDAPAADSSLTVDKPSDSSGVDGDIKLGFASITTAALNLADTPLVVDSNITLTFGKLSIAAIKLKTDKDETAKEKTHREGKKKKEKETTAAFETEAGIESEETTLTAKEKTAKEKENSQKAKESKEKSKDKVKAAKTKLAAKEKEELDAEAESDKNLKFKGPYIYNLLSSSVEGEALPDAKATDGTYKRIEFQLKRNLSVEEDSPLFGSVIALEGTYTVNGTSKSFVLNHHVSLNLRIAGATGFNIEPSKSNALQIAFDPTKWFTDMDLSAAEVDSSDGKIYINKSSNKELLKTFTKNIRTALKFGKDKDGDGKVEDSGGAGVDNSVEDED